MAVPTDRSKKLQSLALSLPGANQQLAQGQQAARQVQLQEQIKNIQPAQATTQVAQGLGAQQATQAGQIQNQAQMQTRQGMQQLGQQTLSGQAREQRGQQAATQLRLNEKQQEIKNKLSGIGRDYQDKLLDDQLAFKRDEAGRTLFNQRQALDLALLQAKDAEELQDFKQAMDQTATRELQLLTTASRKIEQALIQGQIGDRQRLDNQSRKDLVQKKRAIDAKIKDQQNKAKNRASMWKAAGAIIGAGVGAFATGGSPQGVTAGAQLGAGLGQIGANL